MDKNISKELEVTIKSYNETAAKYSKYYYPRKVMQSELIKLMKHIPDNGIVLDLGCGPGQDSAFLLQKGMQVIGIDLSEEMIRIASKKTLKGNL